MRPVRYHRFALAALASAAMLMSGCTGTRSVSTRLTDAPRTAESERLEQRLRDEVRTWEGTPHQWGGTTRAGADCSGFVMRLYRDVLGIDLPRTTEDQAQYGDAISDRLRPGDLVFFRTAPKTRHVGVYLSEGEFAHASSSEGVRISELDENYWKERFWMSRRILGFDEPVARRDPPRVTERHEYPSPPPDIHAPGASARVGW